MSEQDKASPASRRELAERSLTGSAYVYVDVGQVSSQTLKEIADNGDD